MIHQQLWKDEVEEKFHLGIREQKKKLNATALDYGIKNVSRKIQQLPFRHIFRNGSRPIGISDSSPGVQAAGT
jgi:hypothetical protein